MESGDSDHPFYEIIHEKMINFTDNLYRSQWLDLVFQNRNKAYGAYALRLNNASTTIRAFLLANVLVVAIVFALLGYQKLKPQSKTPIVESEAIRLVDVKIFQMKKPAPAPAPKTAAAQPKLKTIRHTAPVVVPATLVTDEPATVHELKSAVISTTTTVGEISTSGNVLDPGAVPGNGSGDASDKGVSDDNGIYDPTGIERYPEFPGGNSAFSKYLSKNLRYPGTARDANIQGKILVSFVVERDGQLSNIRILRGIGFGCDEEAIRVLQRSPRWTPGEQNKRQVRVAYTLPINFQLPD